MFNAPLGYFITFRTHGSWLHGDDRGSVDSKHNTFGTPVRSPNPARATFERSQMTQDAVDLTDKQRTLIHEAIMGVCDYRKWTLHALNVRTNHVHIVVTCDTTPEAAMNTFKAYATRALRTKGLSDPESKVWSHHGSTIYLFRHENMQEKVKYVLEGQ